MKRFTVRDPVIKSVKPKDRIKYWNVVPGDQIRLLGDSSNRLHEVLSINKISNRVFVKGAVVSVFGSSFKEIYTSWLRANRVGYNKNS